MSEIREYLSSWYTVVDQDGEDIFEIRFYTDPSEFESGFTFDDPDGNDWICRKLDSDELVIHAEPMTNYIERVVSDYLEDKESDNVVYGYVEMV